MNKSLLIFTVFACLVAALCSRTAAQTAVPIYCMKYEPSSTPFCGEIFSNNSYTVYSMSYSPSAQLSNDQAAEREYNNRHNTTLASAECKTALKSMLCSFYTNKCQDNYFLIEPCQSVCTNAKAVCDPAVFFDYDVNNIGNYCNKITTSRCFDGEKVVGASSTMKASFTLLVVALIAAIMF